MRAVIELLFNNFHSTHYPYFVLFYLYNIFVNNKINQISMLPVMRYETKKLAELYHNRKSYRDHRQSIQKIRHKQIKSPLERTQELSERRNRMHSSFNYNQMVKNRDIKKSNLMLYEKCFMGKNRKTASEFNPEGFHEDERKDSLDSESMQNLQKSQEKSQKDFLLKNHRSYPINKMTSYERARENLRLSVKIADPCPAINTKKLQKIHEQALRRKERIMRYDSSNLKSSRYIDKRLSLNNFNSSKSSLLMTSRSKNQENTKQSLFRQKQNYQNQTVYLKKYRHQL